MRLVVLAFRPAPPKPTWGDYLQETRGLLSFSFWIDFVRNHPLNRRIRPFLIERFAILIILCLFALLGVFSALFTLTLHFVRSVKYFPRAAPLYLIWVSTGFTFIDIDYACIRLGLVCGRPSTNLPISEEVCVLVGNPKTWLIELGLYLLWTGWHTDSFARGCLGVVVAFYFGV